MELKEAMKVLVKALEEDEGYRYGWQANIAMAFKDEYARSISGNDTIHDISNKAAINFLTILTSR